MHHASPLDPFSTLKPSTVSQAQVSELRMLLEGFGWFPMGNSLLPASARSCPVVSLPRSPGPAKRDAGGRQLVAPSQGTGTYFIQSLYGVCPRLRRRNKI